MSYYRYGRHDWHPEQHRTMDRRSTLRLTPGDLVALRRKPFEVVRWWERAVDLWPEEYTKKWDELREYNEGRSRGLTELPSSLAHEWEGRPVTIALKPVGASEKTKPSHYTAPASYYWYVLPDHFSLCRLCGELPPCRHVLNERIAEDAAERMEEIMAMMPGCCHGCREPISSRQKTVVFEGPNLIRPDFGDDSAIFHARGSCRWSVERYDEKLSAKTGVKRRFYCDGLVTIHADDSAECTEFGECPDPKVSHRTTVRHYRDQVYRGAIWRGCWCVSGDIVTA